MELQRYWHVLVRRWRAVRNVFVLVALLSVVSVAYSYYGARYLGRTVIGVQVQPNPVNNAVVDPQQAAYQNTGDVVNDLASYGTNTIYFKDVSAELAHKYGIQKDWKAIGSSLQVVPATSGHGLYIGWKDTTDRVATAVVAAAADQMRAYVPLYHARLQSHSPAIVTTVTDPANARRESLSKPVADVLLRLALGLVAGIILAYLLEYLDNTIKGEADVQQYLNVPVLGVIPPERPARRGRRA